jgi:hypothetical protein
MRGIVAAVQFARDLGTWPWYRPVRLVDVDRLSVLAQSAVGIALRWATGAGFGEYEVQGICFVTRKGTRGARREQRWVDVLHAQHYAAECRMRTCAYSWEQKMAVYGAAQSEDSAHTTRGHALMLAAGSTAMLRDDIFAPLCEIWRMGCIPVGVVDGWFVIWAGDDLAGQEIPWEAKS